MEFAWLVKLTRRKTLLGISSNWQVEVGWIVSTASSFRKCICACTVCARMRVRVCVLLLQQLCEAVSIMYLTEIAEANLHCKWPFYGFDPKACLIRNV